jgi:predicted RNA-binding Zn-ribbon protein involved in translation (DUF1610 family)
MRQFRVHCQSCGDVLVKARDVTLPPGSYCFDCPRCGASVRQPATERETALLSSHGATIVDDATDPKGPAQPAPLTLDDVITLHELLQDDGWFQSLLDAPARGPLGTPAARPLRSLPDRPDDQGRRS